VIDNNIDVTTIAAVLMVIIVLLRRGRKKLQKKRVRVRYIWISRWEHMRHICLAKRA
jgi:hypothetical protein